MTSTQPQPLSVERARALTREIHALLRCSRRDLAAVARKLRAIKHGELYRALGYTNIYAYAKQEYDLGRTKVKDLIGIVQESDRLPKLREAFNKGEIPYTKAREWASVATPEDEGDWLDLSTTTSGRDLRDLARGSPPSVRRGFSFTPEQAARFDQLIAGFRDKNRGTTDSEAVLHLIERGVAGPQGEAPVRRLVVNQCPSCQLVTTESREGSVVVSETEAELARCSGEVHDLREEPNVVKRAVPARTRRGVLDRDRRCLVPGCRALGGLDIHHADGWRKGHDPKRLATLCSAHHRECHDGYLKIEGSYPDLVFLGLDGQAYGAPTPEFCDSRAKEAKKGRARSNELASQDAAARAASDSPQQEADLVPRAANDSPQGEHGSAARAASDSPQQEADLVARATSDAPQEEHGSVARATSDGPQEEHGSVARATSDESQQLDLGEPQPGERKPGKSPPMSGDLAA